MCIKVKIELCKTIFFYFIFFFFNVSSTVIKTKVINLKTYDRIFSLFNVG